LRVGTRRAGICSSFTDQAIKSSQDANVMSFFNHADDVELTVHFRCNLRCRHYMILDTMDWLRPADERKFSELLEENRQLSRWKGLILTGSEVTLRSDLPLIAKRARDAGFEHVRIQTHGMRLADLRYCQTLVDAGIDEFFISLTADSAELHDSITEVPGSFEKTLLAIHNLGQFPAVRQMTNTVVTKLCYRCLPQVVELLKDVPNLVEMDFWNYWPMTEEGDPNLLVSHIEAQPFLRSAVRMARSLGR
jgi:MoaA/NifB/PqqE/SkfB family radical SAM enzyme